MLYKYNILNNLKKSYNMTDRINKPIVTGRLTSGRDIFNSIPRLSDACITVISTFGKVLCYYFVEVSTWHHTRELPYWC